MLRATNTTNQTRPFKLAVIALHVVQYHSPLYAKLAASPLIDLTVFYLDRIGAEPYFDPSMGALIKWDTPLLRGYEYKFLRNLSPFKETPGIKRVNPNVIWEVATGKYDAVLLQSYDTLSQWFALFAAKVSRKKVLFRGEALINGSDSTLRKAIKGIPLNLMMRLADAVLYSCTGNKKCFEYFGCRPEKLHPIPCAVDNAYFRTQRKKILAEGLDARAQLGIEHKAFVVLSVARMSKRKRLADLLEAYRILRDRGYAAALVLVGDGPERPHLEARVREQGIRDVHFIGYKNQSEISVYYDIADTLVICSEVDPSPKAVNEALNFALPAIVTRGVGTLGDVVVEGENGFAFDTGDVDALANLLERMASDPDLRNKMGARSLELANLWSLEEDVQNVEVVLRKLLLGKTA